MHMYVCMYVCTYVRTYVRTYVCMYVCIYIYVCMCIYCFSCRFLAQLRLRHLGAPAPNINVHCRSVHALTGPALMFVDVDGIPMNVPFREFPLLLWSPPTGPYKKTCVSWRLKLPS